MSTNTKKKKADAEANAATAKAAEQDQTGGILDIPPLEGFDDEYEDGAPQLDPDDICHVLDEFLRERENRANALDAFGNPAVKKKNDFEDEEQ